MSVLSFAMNIVWAPAGLGLGARLDFCSGEGNYGSDGA